MGEHQAQQQQEVVVGEKKVQQEERRGEGEDRGAEGERIRRSRKSTGGGERSGEGVG